MGKKKKDNKKKSSKKSNKDHKKRRSPSSESTSSSTSSNSSTKSIPKKPENATQSASVIMKNWALSQKSESLIVSKVSKLINFNKKFLKLLKSSSLINPMKKVTKQPLHSYGEKKLRKPDTISSKKIKYIF